MTSCSPTQYSNVKLSNDVFSSTLQSIVTPESSAVVSMEMSFSSRLSTPETFANKISKDHNSIQAMTQPEIPTDWMSYEPEHKKVMKRLKK
jgi:hypothetical protein